MGTHRRGVAAVVASCFLLSTTLSFAKDPSKGTTAVEPPVGSKAAELLVLPPWTFKRCPKALHGTYTAPELKLLRLRDNDCALWRTKAGAYDLSVTRSKKALDLLEKTIASFEKERAFTIKELDRLNAELKKTVADRNKYKYKPNNSWLFITIGAALAAVGVAFGVGVWLAKD